MSLFIARECCDFIAYADTARLNLSLKASECVVGTANSLNRLATTAGWAVNKFNQFFFGTNIFAISVFSF